MSLPFLQSGARRSERVVLNAQVALRRPGQLGYRVKVFDASLHGCRLEFIERPRLDEQLWVKFDGLQPLEAEVCWVDSFIAGVNFVQPIHSAVFERLIAGMPRP